MEEQVNSISMIEDVYAQEMYKCASDFIYFAEKYVKFMCHKEGLIPLKLYDYQKHFIQECQENRYLIGIKYRQGGFSLILNAFALWTAMFKCDQRVLSLYYKDRMARYDSYIVQKMIEQLPIWLKPKMGKVNDHQISFEDTGSTLYFYTKEASCGLKCDVLIVDEAAYTPNMEQHWKALWPMLSCGAKVIVMSTPNGTDNWFHEIVESAKKGHNCFKLFQADIKDHPEYCKPEWQAQTRIDLGECGWKQEFLCEFLEPKKPEKSAHEILIEFAQGLTPKQAEKLVTHLKTIVDAFEW